MLRSRLFLKLLLGSLLLLSAYATISLILGPGASLSFIANSVLCLVALLANFGFLINTATGYRRPKAFWTFLAAGCALWLAGQLVWMVGEVERRSASPLPSTLADLLFFLSLVPMLAAIGVRPHRRRYANALRFGFVDLALLVAWFGYLYAFFILPWAVILRDAPSYSHRYFWLTTAANLLLLSLLAASWRRAAGAWRHVYGELFGAATLHAIAWLVMLRALIGGRYYNGSLLDLPMLASFLWFGLAGLEAFRLSPAPEGDAAGPADYHLAFHLALLGILAMPLLAGWAMVSDVPGTIRHFRVEVTLGAILVGVLLLLLRQHQVDRYRRSLLRDTGQSLDHLNRLQTQLVLSEKLASLGELAAGAAHAINNPLTAIIGYADLLESEPELGDRARAAAAKIQQQAQRIRALVENLFGFARQVPAERALLDINAILSSAVALRRSQLAENKIHTHLEIRPALPAVRGDPRLLLQVFYELMNNAADAMQPDGGDLRIITRREGGNIVVEFADNGPGLAHPDRVFDPFYTTKTVGQGTGLGLSLCYGIVQEHGGQLSCRNGSEGGAIFRIELPAVILPLPLQHLLEPATRTS